MMNLERAKELRNNPVWGEICEELDKKIFHLSEKLFACTTEELKDLQAEIRVYRAVKKLPDAIVSREESVEGKL